MNFVFGGQPTSHPFRVNVTGLSHRWVWGGLHAYCYWAKESPRKGLRFCAVSGRSLETMWWTNSPHPPERRKVSNVERCLCMRILSTWSWVTNYRRTASAKIRNSDGFWKNFHQREYFVLKHVILSIRCTGKKSDLCPNRFARKRSKGVNIQPKRRRNWTGIEHSGSVWYMSTFSRIYDRNILHKHTSSTIYNTKKHVRYSMHRLNLRGTNMLKSDWKTRNNKTIGNQPWHGN